MWDKRKREEKKAYFEAQRKNKTGNFTEYITRVYYNILKQANRFDGCCCPQRYLNFRTLTYDIYAGIYDQPDHDAYGTIQSCIKELKNMGYIHEEVINDRKYFVIDKDLDYLLEGEHEKYLKKYKITNDYEQLTLDIEINETKKQNDYDHSSKLFSCLECQGHYVLKEGKYGYFYGCNHFPNCHSTRKVSDITYDMLQENGLAVYELKLPCWKCHHDINIISYFPYFDLCNGDSNIATLKNLKIIRLSVLEKVDTMLKMEYPHIQDVYSKKAGFAYPANTCEHCGALQGSTLALEKMLDQLMKINKNGELSKHIIKHIPIDDTTLTRKEWEEVWHEII